MDGYEANIARHTKERLKNLNTSLLASLKTVVGSDEILQIEERTEENVTASKNQSKVACLNNEKPGGYDEKAWSAETA